MHTHLHVYFLLAFCACAGTTNETSSCSASSSSSAAEALVRSFIFFLTLGAEMMIDWSSSPSSVNVMIGEGRAGFVIAFGLAFGIVAVVREADALVERPEEVDWFSL